MNTTIQITVSQVLPSGSSEIDIPYKLLFMSNSDKIFSENDDLAVS